MREGKLGRYLRYASLAGFLGFMTYVAYRHQVVGGGPSGVPPVDALCPFGGLESLYSYLKHGTFLRRVAMSSLLLFGTVAASTLLLGRTFCGWICPLGALGEAAGALGRRLGFKVDQRRIPHTARHVKLLILGVVLAGSWATGTLVFRPYDPWVAWAHLGGGLDEIAANPWGFAVLALLVILAGMGISRFFCRYLCPPWGRALDPAEAEPDPGGETPGQVCELRSLRQSVSHGDNGVHRRQAVQWGLHILR